MGHAQAGVDTLQGQPLGHLGAHASDLDERVAGFERLQVAPRVGLGGGIDRRRLAFGLPLLDLLDQPPEPGRDVLPGFVRLLPAGYGPGIAGQGLELAEGCALPGGGTHHHRHHHRFPRTLPFQGAHDLHARAVVRGQEVVADQQQDQVGALQFAVDLSGPIASGQDLAVAPTLDQPLAPKQRQRLLQADAVAVVLVGVAEEDPQRLGRSVHVAFLRLFRRQSIATGISSVRFWIAATGHT